MDVEAELDGATGLIVNLVLLLNEKAHAKVNGPAAFQKQELQTFPPSDSLMIFHTTDMQVNQICSSFDLVSSAYNKNIIFKGAQDSKISISISTL